MADQQRAAKGENIACACKVETGQQPEFGGDHHADCLGPENADGGKDQRPDAIAEQCQRQRNASADQRSGQIDDCRFFELQLARHQCLRQDQQRRRKEDQRLPAQHIGDDRFLIISGGQGSCDKDLYQRQPAIQQNQHAKGLPDADFLNLVLLDQRADKAVTVEEIQEHQHGGRHGEQAIIAGIKDAQHRQRHPPADNLRHNLRARPPENRAAHAVSKIARGALHCHALTLHEYAHSANRLPKDGVHRAVQKNVRMGKRHIFSEE